MKKALIFLLFLPIFSFSQKKSFHSVGGGLNAPLMSMPIFSTFSFGGPSIPEGKSQFVIGYSVDFMGTYFFGKRRFLRIGVGHEHSRFSIKTENFVDFNFSTGSLIEGTLYENASIKSIFLPFDYGWLIPGTEDDLKIYMGIGLQYNHVFSSIIEEQFEQKGELDLLQDGYSDLYTSSTSGRIFFSFEYPFFSKTLIFEPMLKVGNRDFYLRNSWSTSIIEPSVIVRLKL